MKNVLLNDIVIQSGVNLGTSGVRSTVVSLTDYVCYSYTKAFLIFLESINNIDEKKVVLAGDYRPSTDRIIQAVAKAILDYGYQIDYAGKLSTPAATLYGIQNHLPSIIVTGSHIPDDRNGIKFNKSDGELLKSEEPTLKATVFEINESLFDENGMFIVQPNMEFKEDNSAKENYIQRYKDFYPSNFLKNKKIGLYGHSSVARDLLFELLNYFGAEVQKLEFSDKFIPVDTEAVRKEDVELSKNWFQNSHYDAIVSTDGDADRPFIADEKGTWLRGDSIGLITAKYLNADFVALSICGNTNIDKSGYFKKVEKTKIGSPYVVEAMINAEKESYKNIVAYEGNGGFLIHKNIEKNGKVLKGLPSRDSFVVIFSLLDYAFSQNKTISQVISELPARFTASDRLKDIPTEISKKVIAEFIPQDIDQVNNLFHKIFPEFTTQVKEVNTLDGMRMTLENDEIIHIRPSGNAPELRLYTEADSQKRAEELNMSGLKQLGKFLGIIN